MNKFKIQFLTPKPEDTPLIISVIDNLNAKISSFMADYNFNLSLLEELRNRHPADIEPINPEPNTHEEYEGIDAFMDKHMPITERVKLSEVSRKIRKITGVKKLRPELEKELNSSAVKYRFINVHNLAFIEPAV